MKSGALRRAIGLTFLYIGCFVLLVLLQFSRGPGFSERFGRMAVVASFPKADRDSSVRVPDSLRIEYAGLSLEISRRSPALLSSPDGSSRPLLPRSVEKLKDGVRIGLEGGVELRASSGPGDRFNLVASAPDGASALRIAYSLSGRAKLASERGASRIEAGTATFDLSFSSASLDNGGYLALGAAEGGLGRFAMVARAAVPTRPVKPAPVEELVAQAPKDPAAFSAEVVAWRDKVWSGLAAGRWDAERLGWKGRAEGDAAVESRFSERALTAYLAEALARGVYTDALAKTRPARERYSSELSYVSAPYLGGLAAKMQAAEAADLAEDKRLAQLVLDKSPDLFAKEALIRFLFDRAPGSLAKDVLAFAATVDPAKLTTRQAVGLLSCVVESRSYLKDEENPFRAHVAVADRIRKATLRTAGGLFLVTEEDGATDSRLSLVAGLQLAAFGAAEGRPELVGVGQGLVEGFLGLADDRGIGSARVVARAGAVEQRSGALLPEEVYALVASNPYYPREVSFYRAIGPGVWAWTCAPSLTLSASEAKYSFDVDFPEGRAHYMVFYGIKPFANIQLYDIDYSPDAEFEIYDASGYLYRKQDRVLYLKMKHKKESESIKLFF